MLQPTFEYDLRRQVLDPASAPAAGPHRTVDLREMIRILRRRRTIVLTSIAGLLALTAAFVLLVTPLYTATSTVLIDPHRSHVADTNDQPPPPSNFGTDDAMIESQVLLIQSVAVLSRVVDELHLTDDPEFKPQWHFWNAIFDLFKSSGPPTGQSPQELAKARTLEILQRRLKVTREGTTFVIDIDASSESPRKSAKIANAVADSYFYEQINSKTNTNKIAATWLNQQLDDLKARVQGSDKAVEDFRASNNLITTQGQTVNDQQLTDLNNKLMEAHVQTAEAKSKYDQVQGIAKSHSDPGTLDQALNSQVITQLRTQYADVAKTVADLSSKFGPQHPQVLNA